MQPINGKVLILSGLLVTATQATAADDDAHAGKALLESSCFQCHGTEYYTRKDRRITSLPKLQSQVERCNTNLELNWFDDEIGAVTQYLNTTFYKFK